MCSGVKANSSSTFVYLHGVEMFPESTVKRGRRIISNHHSPGSSVQATGGVYIHVPFCHSKCFYCDFYSLAGREDVIELFIECLEREVRRVAAGSISWSVDTLYIGGGTPSLLPPAGVERLMHALDDVVGLGAVTEITLEANPGEAPAERLRDYRRLGVNRLSLGIQSFDPAVLDFLGRVHGPKDSQRTFAAARQAGFDNISVDLIFNVPGQSLEQWQADLERVLELQPEHISAYSLTVEAGTGLAEAVDAGEVIMPAEETDYRMFTATRELLTTGGYSAYEASNFARDGRVCRHNLHYWRIEPYLGLGPAAHGFDGSSRYWNVRDLDEYLRRDAARESPRSGSENLTVEQLANERLAFGLRLAEGVSVTNGLGFGSSGAFRRHFAAQLQRWCGKVELSGTQLRATPAGVLFLDSLAADFMLPADQQAVNR